MQYRVRIFKIVETAKGARKHIIGNLDFDNVDEAQAMRRILRDSPFLSVLDVRFRINYKWIEVDSFGIGQTIGELEQVVSELKREREQIDRTERIG